MHALQSNENKFNVQHGLHNDLISVDVIGMYVIDMRLWGEILRIAVVI